MKTLALNIALLTAVSGITPVSAAGDVDGFYRRTLPGGCYVNWYFIQPTKPDLASTFTWSGPCTSGKPVSGKGTLTIIKIISGTPPQGTRKSFVGTLSEGYLDGDSTRTEESLSNSGWIPWPFPPAPEKFKMGCHLTKKSGGGYDLGDLNCRPGG